MYIKKFLQWSLVFLAFVAYKQIDANNDDQARGELVYMVSQEAR